MSQRKQSDTGHSLDFFMTDSSDHISGKTGLSPTVTISKDGGAFASPSGAVTEIAHGWYKIAGNATDSNTLGPLKVHATATGADPADREFQIVSHDPFALGTAQTGDAYARLGAPAGASVSADVAAVKSDTASTLTATTIGKKILKNRTETNPSNGTMTVYDDDGTTPLYTCSLYSDVAGSTLYDGTAGVNRRDALA